MVVCDGKAIRAASSGYGVGGPWLGHHGFSDHTTSPECVKEIDDSQMKTAEADDERALLFKEIV
jgi:hypothetical protein